MKYAGRDEYEKFRRQYYGNLPEDVYAYDQKMIERRATELECDPNWCPKAKGDYRKILATKQATSEVESGVYPNGNLK